MFVSLGAKAQKNSEKSLEELKFKVNVLHNGKTTITEDEIEGSAYLNKNYEPGFYETISGQRVENVPLRYNIYKDYVEGGKDDGTKYFLQVPSLIKTLCIGERQFVY